MAIQRQCQVLASTGANMGWEWHRRGQETDHGQSVDKRESPEKYLLILFSIFFMVQTASLKMFFTSSLTQHLHTSSTTL